MKHDNLIKRLLKNKILIMDGAMGTMIQNEKLGEKDFRGKKFSNSKINLFGNNDILNITQEDLIYQIHTKYLEKKSLNKVNCKSRNYPKVSYW